MNRIELNIMDIEDIIAYLICFSPMAILVGLTMWLAWRDKDRFE